MRRFFVRALSAFSAIAILSNCTKSTDLKPQPQPACTITSISPDTGQPGTTVIINGTGFASNLADNAVTFNGVDALVTAATSTQLNVTAPTALSGPLKVSVKGTPTVGPTFSYYDLYAFGYYGGFGTYWKNGVEAELTVGPNLGSIVDLKVIGSDVYAIGEVDSVISPGNYSAAAAFWKNGKVVSVPGVNPKGAPTSTIFKKIVAAGSDVYICGGTNAPWPLTYHVALKYWKNGTEVQLTSGTTTAEVYDMAVSGSDVYVIGRENGISMYWKNGTAFPLSNGTAAKATAVAVNGNDLYICGSTSAGTAVLWKNGVYSVLDATNHFIFPTAMAVSNGDLYISGIENTGSVAVPVYVARVMKNGAVVQMPDIILKQSFVPSVDVLSLAVINSNTFVMASSVVYKNGVALPPPVHQDLFIRFYGITANVF